MGRGREWDLGEQGTVGVVGDQQGGLDGRSHQGSLRGSGVFAGNQALVSALAQVPEHDAHHQGGHKEDGKEDGLIAGNHGSRASVRHSSKAAARVEATRA